MTEKDIVAEETNADAAAVEKRTDDGVDMQALLSEFEEGTSKPAASPPESSATPQVDLSKLKDQVKAELKSEQDNAQAIKSLVKTVRGEISPDVFSDEEIEDWLDGQAKRNPQLGQAWMQRSKNPAVWAKIESGLSNKFNGKFKNRIDPDATADRDAVAHAVRGASNKVAAEPAPDLSKMSDAELRKYTQDNWGFSV